MMNIKLEKGITVISLIMTIIVLSILATVTVYSIKSSNNVAPYNKMLADITLLEDKLLIYYNKNGEIPKMETEVIEGYYKIDLTKLDGITLNFGMGEDEEDYYLVNDNLKVYYLAGIKNGEEIVHTKD